MLNFPLKPYELSDDIESFIHVLILFALRFHRHNLSPDAIKGVLEEYDRCEVHNGYWTGSFLKLTLIRGGMLSFALVNNDAFKELLSTLSHICQQHYASLDEAELQRYAVAGHEPEVPAQVANTTPPEDDLDSLESEFADTAPSSTTPDPFLPPSKPNAHPHLKTHDKFAREMLRCLRLPNWTPNDKGEDQFAAIDWLRGAAASSVSRTTRSKRTADELATGQPQTKKSRTSAPQNGSSQLKRSKSKTLSALKTRALARG